MTSTYLQRTQSVTLDANGNGTVMIGPDVSQWWTPKFVRVSTLANRTPTPYCAVYHGPKTITNFSVFVDDTWMGSGDTSSMISGVIVQNGDALTAQWSGGVPGDTAILSIYGVSSDVPPPISEMPSVPGTHFSGRPAAEILSLMSQMPASAPGPLTLGGNSSASAGPFDVRGCQSYYFNVTANVSGAATKYNAVNVNLQWSTDSSGANVVYQESIEWWASTPTAAFVFNGGALNLQDEQHGPYVTVVFNNLAGNNPVNYTWSLFCTSRILSGPFFQQALPPGTAVQPINGVNGLILNFAQAFPASGTLKVPMPLAYGEISLLMINGSAANAMTLKLDYGSDTTNNTVSNNVAFQTQLLLKYLLPKRAGLLTMTGTLNDFVGVRIASLYSRQ